MSKKQQKTDPTVKAATKKDQPKPLAPHFVYIVRQGGRMVALGGGRTTSPDEAEQFRDEAAAQARAKEVRGVVATVHSSELGRHVPQIVSADQGPRLAVDVKPPRAPRKPKEGVLAREAVVALLRDSGLPLTEKGSSHYGGQTGGGKTLHGPRIVLPPAAQVRVLYVYELEAPELPGYADADARKAQGLGKVTHVVKLPTAEQVADIIKAVQVARELSGSSEVNPDASAKDNHGQSDRTNPSDLVNS